MTLEFNTAIYECCRWRLEKKRQINLKFEAVNLLAVFLLLLKKKIQ